MFVNLWIFFDSIIVWAPSILHCAWEICNMKWGFARKVIIKSQRQFIYLWFEFLWIRRYFSRQKKNKFKIFSLIWKKNVFWALCLSDLNLYLSLLKHKRILSELYYHLLWKTLKNRTQQLMYWNSQDVFLNILFSKIKIANTFSIFLNTNLEIVQTYQTLLHTLVNRICTLKLTKTGQILGSQEEGRKLRI